MAHQFSALHCDGFVRVSHKTRERLREVNMLALGLITEMSAHIDGFPVTLNAIIKRAKKPGATALREAYQNLIDERLVVYVQYTLQLPGKRPYPSGTTVIAHEAVTDEEFATEIVDKFKPGQVVLDRQADDEVRKVKVLAATVRYWGGEKKITENGSLVAPTPKKKPGPKQGSRTGRQPTKPDPTQRSVELDESSSTLIRENEESDQVSVELDNMDSTTPSPLTRPVDENTNQTTGAGASTATSQTGSSGNDGWLAGSAEKDQNMTAGASLLRSLGITGRALSDWTVTVDAALVQLGEQQTRHTLENGLADVAKPSGAIIKTRLPQLHGRLTSGRAASTKGNQSGTPAWCGECGDPNDPNRERKCTANVRMRTWPDGTPCSCRTADVAAA